MKLSPLARRLYEEFADLAVIGAHEHLPAEADYLAFGHSGPNLFAGGHIWHDLESAGLAPEFKATLRDGGHRPVESWWPAIRPHWEQIRHGSYARALLITAQDLYGLSEISDRTIGELAARVQADNAPGLYHRILQERCRARVSITCVDQAAFPDDPGLRGITSLQKFDRWSSPLTVLSTRLGREVRSLEETAAAAQELLRDDLARGALGFKMTVAEHRPPDLTAAEAEVTRLVRTGESSPCPALLDYLFDKCLDVAAESGVPVAVHTGYWGDFRELDPKLLLSFALRRRDVRFDLFHLGMPMVRDASLIGKSLPNVTLNLCWCAAISQLMTARALAELVDLVPLNKVIAFGGDYRVAVQKVYGHLVMAKETVASALAEHMELDAFDKEEALRIARLWFHDNPARIYGLETPEAPRP